MQRKIERKAAEGRATTTRTPATWTPRPARSCSSPTPRKRTSRTSRTWTTPADKKEAKKTKVINATIEDVWHRRDDIPAFYGGGGIAAGGGICSSGYAAKKSNGTIVSVTAGHCWANGTAVTTESGARAVRNGLRPPSADVQRGRDGRRAPERAELRRPDLHRRHHEHDEHSRRRGRCGHGRLHELLPQRPDHRPVVWTHRIQHQRPGVHGDRLQVTGDRVVRRQRHPARRLRRDVLLDRRYLGLDSRQHDRERWRHRPTPSRGPRSPRRSA